MKDALRKATYLWFEAEFSSIHRSTSTSIIALPENALASTLRLQVASCEDDDYVHAKRNDNDVPQNNRCRKTQKASHSFFSLQLKTKDDRTVVLSRLLQMIELSTNQKTNKTLQRSKKVG